MCCAVKKEIEFIWSVEATVVYYIKPTQNILPSPRPYLGYGVIPIGPVTPPSPFKYVDYRWLNIKNTGVLAVPGIPDSPLPYLKYAQPFSPLAHLGPIPYRFPHFNPLTIPVPLHHTSALAIIPVPYARRLQFIRLRRNSSGVQSISDTDDLDKDESVEVNGKVNATSSSSAEKE
ncbi:unnamed protein product [Bemisia tabaci]|uniref:Uncharacterized protein n=1 Tax=Bemisia tabaci TaxID=7038 RepID=A0A9P0AH84_BEMTA|nr:unnamed protein product [Bemisia tabaci]